MNTALLLLLATGISGRVTSGDHSPVATAVVSVTRPDSNWRRLLLTNARGEFSLQQLAPGRYELEAVKPGLKVATRTIVTVRPGPPQIVTLRMTVDTSAKTVALESVIP